MPVRTTGPGIDAEGLQRLQLLATRSQLGRLDVWPFLALYFLVVARAVYHASKFEWHMLTLWSYGLLGCALLHVLAFLASNWSTRLGALVACKPVRGLDAADRVLVVPDKFNGSVEVVRLERRTLREGLKVSVEVGFEFRKHRFVYNGESHAFEKLRYPVKETIDSYLKATGHGTEAKALAAHDKFGLNKCDVPVPPFGSLLKEHLVAPFFCFQVFCVFLWMMDQYWYYSLFTLFMLVSFECTLVAQRQRNLKELRSLQTPKQAVPVYRCGKWETLPGEALFPGDIISIARPSGAAGLEERVVPADCLLLGGTCIAEEAVLTGESTPQWKLAVTEMDPAETLNIKRDKSHVLFGGTKILQHTGDKAGRIRTPDGGCLALVLRTGFETAQGRLMRTIMFSTERVTANSWEAGLFIAFLLIFALAAAWHVLSNGLKDEGRDRFKLVLNCIMIITSVIPPELPMELAMAVNASLVALARKRVFCTEPFRIPFAGKVDVCCFDKTGTLTSDHLLLEEVVVGGPEQVQAAHRVMATCQSLVTLTSGAETEVVGDPLEKAALESVEWTVAGDTVSSPDRGVTATILHRHHFSSNLKRMTCLVRVALPNGVRYEAVMKGAPEVVKQFLVSPPPDYDAQYKRYAAQGARVIALAAKDLGPEAAVDVTAIRAQPREALEAGMKWAGFAIFSCPLKPESEPALAQLRASSHQLVMITGDAPLTACFAASKVHIVTRDVLVLSHTTEEKGQAVHGPSKGKAVVEEQQDSDFVWISPDEAVQIPFSRDWQSILAVATRYDLAVSGDALAYLDTIGLASQVIPLVQVFARVSPEQKEQVVVALRGVGRTVLMCGDGTNDVGGLKAAHVGVALLSPSEAAIKAMKAKKEKEKAKKDDGKGGKEERKRASSSGGAKPGAKPSTDLAAASGSKDDDAPEQPKRKGQGTLMLEKARAAGQQVTPRMEKMAAWLDKMDADASGGMAGAEPPMLKPGDASMASPFTAKAASVAPCTDIIKQGRSTLVTTVQMFKILGLLCLSTAYGLSVMYLQGVKMSDLQATLNGMLTAALFFFISQAKPREELSAVRPHPHIFTPYFFISLMGQFSVHLALLVYMYHLSLAAMPEGERLAADSEFKPNLVNSVTYMVEAIIQLSTFTVNYMGHPFNNSISESRVMSSVLKYMALFLFLVLYDIIPGLASGFGMVPIPDNIRYQLLILGTGAVGFNYSLEQWLRVWFPAPIPPEKGYMAHIKGYRHVAWKPPAASLPPVLETEEDELARRPGVNGTSPRAKKKA